MPPFVPVRRSRRQSATASPLALVRVPYRHGDLLAAGGDYPRDGERPVPLRPFCERLGIDLPSQLKKLKGHSWTCVVMITMQAGSDQTRKMACIPLRSLPMWLALINPRKVAPEVRELLEAYQLEAAEVLRRHFLPGGALPASAPPAPPPELPPAPTPSAPRLSAALLRARDLEAIEDELAYLRVEAGRVEVHAGLLGPVRGAVRELFARVERLEGRLGLALVPPAWSRGGSDGAEEQLAQDPDTELGALRVELRQMRGELGGLKTRIGVEPGAEVPSPAVVAPRETAVTTPARVRAFLLECTEALEPDVRTMRSRKPGGMTAPELAVAYDAWAEQRGIPTLGAHALAQQLANLDTPRTQYRRRFYFAVRLRAAVPTA